MQLPVAFRPIFQNFYSAMEKFYDRARIQATTSQLGSRLPKQIQRALPVYVACILLVLFLANIDSFGSQDSGTDVFKRDLSRRSTLTGHEFPRKIWQTWKVNPLGFEEKNLNVARTWTEKNPGHRYEVLTDSNDMYYVETHFGPAGLNRPDIVYMYRNLTAKIIKADLLRYLIMYIEGGLYTDIDVEALRPIERFIPDRYNEKDIDMVIGVEIDQPDYIDHPILGPKSQSFCQWTFMCKPRLPVMMRLVENILKWLNEVAQKQNVPVSEIVLDFDEVISGTGPSAFTTAVLAEMTARHGETVDWDYFHDIVESKLVGGVLVLTVEAFAAGQGHSDSGNHNARNALVKHHYHASGWPTNHPRYNHPVYGEVEKCNWNVECVRLWDEHKAAFEALSPEEQAKQIAEKEAADKAEAAEKEAKEAAEKAAKEAEEKEKEAKEAAKEAAWEAAKKAANPLDFTLWDTNKAALEAQAVLETLPPDEQAKQIAEKDAAAAKLALLALPDEQAKQMAEKDAAAAKLALLAPPEELAKQKAEKEKEVAAPPLVLGPPSP